MDIVRRTTIKRATIKSLALFLFVPVIVASCATVVEFDVEHPPLVDLRSANTITVIPFEWDSIREYAYLSQCVTAALINGLRRGGLEFINPYTVENNRERSYKQFADVYITGRITNVYTYDNIETKEETYGSQIKIRELITRTANVDIEYSYFRSSDNRMLENFKKKETASVSFEQIRYREHDTDRNTNRNTGRGTNRDTRRRGAGRTRGAFPQRGTWQESITESAIAQFSDTMNREISLWTTTESRNIKKRTGDDTLAAEAKNLINQNRYNEAFTLYKTIYEQNGNIFAGYNAAILLAANEQFSDALGLLERLRERSLKEGKTVPSFIKKEIKKITGFINDFRVLEVYKSKEAKKVSSASVPAADAMASGREIAGTVNVNPATVYALNGSVSSMNDNSIFPKTVTYADAVNGRWSMRLPDAAPAILWLLVTDGPRDYYITKTAINLSGTIVLNTAEMIKLTDSEP